MDGLEQETARQLAKPPIDRAPVAEMDRQHPPAAARSHEIAHRVDHFPELDLAGPSPAARLGHQRTEPLPSLIRQIRWIALGLLRDGGHPASLLWRPHPELQSHHHPDQNPNQEFPNGLLQSEFAR